MSFEEDTYRNSFAPAVLRQIFAKRVLSFLGIQLGLISLVMFGVKEDYELLQYLSTTPALVLTGTTSVCLILGLFCFRRMTPWNYCLLLGFNVTEAFLLSAISYIYITEVFYYAVAMAALTFDLLALYAIVFTPDYSVLKNTLMSLSIIFVLTCLIWLLLWKNVVKAATTAFTCSTVVIYSLGKIISARNFTKEKSQEYLLASVVPFLMYFNRRLPSCS